MLLQLLSWILIWTLCQGLECTNKASAAPISPETSTHLVSVHINSLIRKNKTKTTQTNKKPKQNEPNKKKLMKKPQTTVESHDRWLISCTCTIYQKVLIKKRQANSSVTNALKNNYIEINLPESWVLGKRQNNFRQFFI